MVQILGGDYPLTIIMPFFLIVIGVVFFITVYIRDNIGKLKLRIKHRHKEEKKQLIDFNKEFSHLKRQVSSLNNSDSLDEISLLIKKYIAERLNISNEFSFEELPRNKLDWSVIEFTKRLSDLKYSGREVTRDELNHLLLFLSKILKVKHLDGKKIGKLSIIPNLIKLPKIEFKFPKFRLFKLKKEIKPAHEIKPLDIGLPRKITINLSWLFKKKEHETKKEVKHEKPKIEIPHEPEHHKKYHRHKPSIFERIRINSQASKVMKLIKKAEKKSLNHPLISKKIYDKALIMYYKLPIDKEEDIAIKFDRFYEKIHGRNERELLQIKHSGRKATKEALSHLKKYRNYVILENNHLNNNLRKSLYDVKRQAVIYLSKTKHRKVKLKLNKFLKALSREESNVFALDERSINNLLKKASSLLKTISRLEAGEGYDAYLAIKRLFSHLKVEHHLPKNDYIEIKLKDLPREIPQPEQRYKINNLDSKYPEIRQVGLPEQELNLPEQRIRFIDEIIKEPRPVRVKPPEIIINKPSKVKIEPPKLPEKKISERMRKLTEEKESVYNKLKSLEEKELDRFKQAKRMSIHENFGYHDFISSIKHKPELNEEHKIKKIFEAK